MGRSYIDKRVLGQIKSLAAQTLRADLGDRDISAQGGRRN
jgi:hypothetical protein